MGNTRTPNKKLQHQRELNGWSQAYVAKQVGTTVKIVSRWECGDCKPLPYYRAKLCKLYGTNAQDLGFVEPEDLSVPDIVSPPLSPSAEQKGNEDGQRGTQAAPLFWNIPHQRNPVLNGREALLQHLHEMLTMNSAIALLHPQRSPQAISGLGGIGKTQTAVEYAYRYQHEYETVLWVKADTRENLLVDFMAIAVLLNLVEKSEKEPYRAVDAVKRWLKDHTDWLLILDNADDLAVVCDFLPTSGTGHTLLTTRASALGRMAKRIEIDTMEPDEGSLFLLRRISIPDYLDLYQVHRSELLKRRSALPSQYPHTVATVWSLSFQKVEQADPAAAELLHLCAFLDPDAIPEEMIAGGIQALSPLLGSITSDQLRVNEAIEVLLRFSLVRRNPRMRMLTIHRLVQAVILCTMNKETQRTWAERAIITVHHTFPNQVGAATRQWCQRCLPHVQVCATLMDQYGLSFAEEAHLFNQAGYFLKEQAFCTEAEPLYQRALAIREQVLGPEHLDTAQSLYNLARLYYDEGRYAEGERLYRRALKIREKELGAEHLDTAQCLNSLALLYWAWGKDSEAEPLYQRALPIREKQLGPEHPDTAHCLNNLALLYVSQGKYAEGERLHRRVLAIREQVLGPDHPDTAQSLQNVAGLYYAEGDQSKYAEAERLYQRSLTIREQVLGPEHLQTAKSLNNLALLYEAQGKYSEAESLYHRAMAIREKALGQENPKTIATVESYAALLRKMRRNEEATALEARIKALQARLRSNTEMSLSR